MIKKITYPRVGFLGNPSDGFGGKTISFPFKNFQAEIVLWQSEELKFLPNIEDQDEFSSVSELYRNTQSQGYYGGIRLIKAAISVGLRPTPSVNRLVTRCWHFRTGRYPRRC